MNFPGTKSASADRLATYSELIAAGSNWEVYSAAYVASNTFSLPDTPTKVHEVEVYNSTVPMYNPKAAFTWTPGSNTVTITDTLSAGDTVYFYYNKAVVNNTTSVDDLILFTMMF